MHRREVAALGLSGLGCVTFSVYGLGLVSSPLGVPKLPLRHAAKDGVAWFGPGFRWCLAVLSASPRGCRFGFVRARLRHVFCPRTGACLFSFRGSKAATSPRCEGRFFAWFEPGFRWCLAVLSASPRGCRFGFVRARLRHVFCLRTGACLFSFRGSKAATSPRCEGRFFAWFEPGFRWCLAVLSASPRGCRFGFVRARLRHVFCLRTVGLVSSPLGVPKLPLRHAAKDGFLLRLSPDLGGVWLFWVHRREVAALGLSGLGCVTFSVYGLGLVSSPLGVPKLPLRHAAKDGVLLGLSPDLGGVWLFWVHRREVAALGLSGLGCVTFSVHGLGLVSSPLGVPKLPLRHAAKDGFLLGLSPDLGGVWLFWVHRREVAALGLSGLGCVTFGSQRGTPKIVARSLR